MDQITVIMINTASQGDFISRRGTSRSLRRHKPDQFTMRNTSSSGRKDRSARPPSVDDLTALAHAVDVLREKFGPRLAARILEDAAIDLQREADKAGDDGG